MNRIDDFQATVADHDDPGQFVHDADAFRQAGEHERALVLLRKGLERHESYLPGYIMLGRILIEQHRVSEALVTFERVLEIDADNPDARTAIDQIMDHLKQDSARHARRAAPAPSSNADAALFPDDAFALIPQDIDELFMTQEPESVEERSMPPATPADTTSVALADLLVGLLEYRDPHFRGGTSLTRLLAAALGRELALSQDEINAIELGVVLRDLGQVPLKDLISRPESELSMAERDRIAGHIETTLNLLAALDLPVMARDVIRHHHERWDGTGYPDGLVGKETPIAARIAGVAD